LRLGSGRDLGVSGDQPTARLLTAEQLADRYQLTVAQIYRLTREGVLPHVKLGRYYRYRLEAVEAFERAEEVVTVSQRRENGA
jgi:excisionase family DNA binding protein